MKKTGLLLAGLAMIFASCSDESLNDNIEASKEDINFNRVLDEVTTINFNDFAAGEIISEVSPAGGCTGVITIMGINPDFPGVNTAMAFDSSNPTGNDFDLGTPNEMFGGPGISSDGPQPSNDVPLGNVLIISEDMDSSDPDDSYVAGSRYEFDFSAYGNGVVTLHSFDMLDHESPGADNLPTTVYLYDGLNNILFQYEIPYGDDNEKQVVDLGGTSGVARMVLELNNSGAIDNLMLTCHQEVEIGGCETMFAKATDGSDTCFIGNGFNRWGWTNGPLSSGIYTMDIYAGASHCETDNREPAGTVTLEYNSITGEAVVTYLVDDGYVLTETHLYLGDGPYPLKRRGRRWVETVAPGQYPYQHGSLDNVSEDTYMVSDLSGDIYMIAHGVICEIMEN